MFLLQVIKADICLCPQCSHFLAFRTVPVPKFHSSSGSSVSYKNKALFQHIQLSYAWNISSNRKVSTFCRPSSWRIKLVADFVVSSWQKWKSDRAFVVSLWQKWKSDRAFVASLWQKWKSDRAYQMIDTPNESVSTLGCTLPVHSICTWSAALFCLNTVANTWCDGPLYRFFYVFIFFYFFAGICK